MCSCIKPQNLEERVSISLVFSFVFIIVFLKYNDVAYGESGYNENGYGYGENYCDNGDDYDESENYHADDCFEDDNEKDDYNNDNDYNDKHVNIPGDKNNSNNDNSMKITMIPTELTRKSRGNHCLLPSGLVQLPSKSFQTCPQYCFENPPT